MAAALRTLLALPPYLIAFYFLLENASSVSPAPVWLSLAGFVVLSLATGFLVREWPAVLLPSGTLVFVLDGWGGSLEEHGDATVGGLWVAGTLVLAALIAFGVAMRRGYQATWENAPRP